MKAENEKPKHTYNYLFNEINHEREYNQMRAKIEIGAAQGGIDSWHPTGYHLAETHLMNALQYVRKCIRLDQDLDRLQEKNNAEKFDDLFQEVEED
jgi:hypothetical protein